MLLKSLWTQSINSKINVIHYFMLGQYAEAKKSPCSDIRAKTFYKGFTCLSSLSLGRGKLTFCTKTIHYLIQFSVRMERLPFTSTGFEWDPYWKFLWVRRWGEQKCQCQLAAIRTHSVHFMPHGTAREKPNSQTIAPNSDVLLSLKAATACYLRLCSLAEGSLPGRARAMLYSEVKIIYVVF